MHFKDKYLLQKNIVGVIMSTILIKVVKRNSKLAKIFRERLAAEKPQLKLVEPVLEPRAIVLCT